jgi:hypothetical protein
VTTGYGKPIDFVKHGHALPGQLKRCLLFTKPLNILKTISPKPLIRHLP